MHAEHVDMDAIDQALDDFRIEKKHRKDDRKRRCGQLPIRTPAIDHVKKSGCTSFRLAEKKYLIAAINAEWDHIVEVAEKFAFEDRQEIARELIRRSQEALASQPPEEPKGRRIQV